MGKESDFVRDVVVKLLEGGDRMMSLQALHHKLLVWIRELPYPEVQIVIDTQTDWDLLAEEVLEGHGPPNLIPSPSFLYVELAVQSEIHAAQYQISSKEKVRRNMDAEKEYRVQQFAYFEKHKRQHHALVDAEAMRQGFIAAIEVIYRGLYRPLQG